MVSGSESLNRRKNVLLLNSFIFILLLAINVAFAASKAREMISVYQLHFG